MYSDIIWIFDIRLTLSMSVAYFKWSEYKYLY